VQEVHRLAVDLGGELWDLVEARLVFPPVVADPPVLDQFDEVPLADAVGPADAGELVGPAGAGQPVAQVVQIGLRNVDAKRLECAHAAQHAPC